MQALDSKTGSEQTLGEIKGQNPRYEPENTGNPINLSPREEAEP